MEPRAVATIRNGHIWLEINNGVRASDQRAEGHRSEVLSRNEAIDLAIQLIAALRYTG